MVSSDPTVCSLLSTTCSFNVAKCSSILLSMFCSVPCRSAPFNRISKKFEMSGSMFVGSSRVALNNYSWRHCQGRHSSGCVSFLASWETVAHLFVFVWGGLVGWFVLVCFSCLCVCFLKVCQKCQLVWFPLLFSFYSWITKVGWKARILVLLICPSPVTLTLGSLAAKRLAELQTVSCIWSDSCAKGSLRPSRSTSARCLHLAVSYLGMVLTR